MCSLYVGVTTAASQYPSFSLWIFIAYCTTSLFMIRSLELNQGLQHQFFCLYIHSALDLPSAFMETRHSVTVDKCMSKKICPDELTNSWDGTSWTWTVFKGFCSSQYSIPLRAMVKVQRHSDITDIKVQNVNSAKCFYEVNFLKNQNISYKHTSSAAIW